MSSTTLSRRHLLGLGSAAAVTAALPTLAAPRAAAAQSIPASLLTDGEALLTSINNGFTFVNRMMDAYASGSTIRLVQSYSDAAVGATAFTYDNAVILHAYLAAGDADDIARAEILGNGLLYAQAHNFPVADGRFAQAYFVNKPSADGAYITPAAAPFYFYTSAVGDQAWAGMALAQLYQRTGNSRYLAGALLVANWIVTNHYDTRGPGGFTWGTTINPQNQSVPSTNGKSTEHNTDCYAFFTMLATLTRDANANNGMSWSALALHAAAFVAAMFQSSGPFFYVGTVSDQVSINPYPIAEDCQTWTFLAGLNPLTQGTIDYALKNLQATDTASSKNSLLTGSQTFRGLVFDSASLTPGVAGADPNAVWFEGTGHTISALVARILRGGEQLPAILSDLNQVVALLTACATAQAQLGAGQTVNGVVIPAGLGLVAASSVLDTGFGYTYGPSLHIGATGWYLLGGLAANPFQLGYRVIG